MVTKVLMRRRRLQNSENGIGCKELLHFVNALNEGNEEESTRMLRVITNNSDKTALIHATIVSLDRGESLVADLLLTTAFDVDVNFLEGDLSLMHHAARVGNESVMESFLRRRGNINVETKESGLQPIHIAAQEGKIKMVELLLKRGANINGVSKDQSQTPLHLAVAEGNVEMVKFLLENEAAVDAHLCWRMFKVILKLFRF